MKIFLIFSDQGKMADEATTASPSAGGDHPTMCPDLQEAISQGTPLKPTTTKEPISGQDSKDS